MNQNLNPTRIMREIPPEWDKIMQLAAQIEHGRIVIKIQDRKVMLGEYTILDTPESNLEVIPMA